MDREKFRGVVFASLVFFWGAVAKAALYGAGELDIQVRYMGGAWHWSVFDGEAQAPLADARFFVNGAAQGTVPNLSAYSFLGMAGAPVWTLPNPEREGLLWLGLDASATGSGVFAGNRLNLRLDEMSGPGDFSIFTVDAFGSPHVLVNSRDGISIADAFSLSSSNGHIHANWAFSAPGEYSVAVSPFGTLAANGQTVSGDAVVWRFTVVPEPSPAILAAVGGAAFLSRRRRPSEGSPT